MKERAPLQPESGFQVPLSRNGAIRTAAAGDIEAVARILTDAFPGLYASTFGALTPAEIFGLLQSLYRAEMLGLEATRIYEQDGEVVGLSILHLGGPIGRGSIRAYWKLLRTQIGFRCALRACAGGIATNAALNHRIPISPDLVYVEALAVTASERGKGVGTALLQDAVHWTRRDGRQRVALHVLRTNIRARRLYERLGFRPSEGRESLFSRALHGREREWSALLMESRFPDTLEEY